METESDIDEIEILILKFKDLVISEDLSMNVLHKVEVTHINDPHDFYVRLIEDALLVKEIENLANLIRPTKITIGQKVIVDLNVNYRVSKYARGRILSVGPNANSYNIFVLDYGFIEREVHEDRIWECNTELLEAPPLAYNCQLNSCVKLAMSWSRATDIFKSEAEGKTAHIYINKYISNKLTVTLFTNRPKDISSRLALLGFTSTREVHNSVGTLQVIDTLKVKALNAYQTKQLKINVPMSVRILSGKSLKQFYVAEIDNYNKFLDYRKDVMDDSEDGPGIAVLKKDDLVSAYHIFDNIYERAIIKEVLDPETAIVQMLDFGRKEAVHIGNLIKMSAKCIQIPIATIYCSTRTNIEGKVDRFLNPGNVYTIQIKELGYGFETPNIVDIL